MLNHEDNERLVRIGPGTPGGELFRRYWQPAALSSELPEKDGAPVRVRLLGEDLVAFRDSGGQVGLLDAFCPHRRAPLFFGRNEECGLRCVYHGWKFNVAGDCIDIPSEPAGTSMLSNVKITTYPTVERGGIIWAYLGPRKDMPQPPDYEWLRAPPTHRHVSKTYERCNYLQAVEGGLDTAHSSFVHNNDIGNFKELRNRDRAPRIEVEVTDYGYRYASTRDAREDGHYIRVYQYMMPNQQMRGGINGLDGRRRKVPRLDGHLWVPIDDSNTWVYNWMCGFDQSAALSREYIDTRETEAGRGPEDLVPGTFQLKRNRENDYLIDRQVQKTKTFSGIVGVNTQDMALQEGMGPIVDRSREHLGTSDRAIAIMRRLLLEAISDVESGTIPRGVDPSTYSNVRPYDDLIREGEDWRQVFSGELEAKW